MCEVATALAVGSAAVGAAGAMHGGRAAESQAESQAALFRAQAAARIQKGEFDAEMARRRWVRNEGTVVARAAGEGINMANFYDVLDDDAKEAALERAAIRYTAQSEAAMLEYQATDAVRRGKDAKTASYFQAAGAVVGAFAPMARNRYVSARSKNGVSLDNESPGYTGNLK